MGESESGAKVDDEENGLTDHQYSRKLFFKNPPPQGFALLPPIRHSPPSPLSPTILS